MKRIIFILTLLFLGTMSSVFAEGRTHSVSGGENIWKISKKLLENATIEEIDTLKDKIIMLNKMNPALDDGIPSNEPGDPDSLVVGQVLVVSVHIDEETPHTPTLPPIPIPINSNQLSSSHEEEESSFKDIQKVNCLQENVNSQEKNINSLQENVNNQHESVNSLQENVNSRQKSVNSLQESINNQEENVKNQQASVNSLAINKISIQIDEGGNEEDAGLFSDGLVLFLISIIIMICIINIILLIKYHRIIFITESRSAYLR